MFAKRDGFRDIHVYVLVVIERRRTRRRAVLQEGVGCVGTGKEREGGRRRDLQSDLCKLTCVHFRFWAYLCLTRPLATGTGRVG